MLPRFIKNAIDVAFVYQEGISYKIATSSDSMEDPAGGGGGQQKYDAIIPVDFASTGVLEKNKRYSEGIQQFLEMKHQLALSDVTMTTNFMSNFSFYRRQSNQRSTEPFIEPASGR